MSINPKFVIIVTCQGQPFYYYQDNLISALLEFAKQYITKKKYGTMRFTLEEVYDVDSWGVKK